jgi:hypothetical protein
MRRASARSRTRASASSSRDRVSHPIPSHPTPSHLIPSHLIPSLPPPSYGRYEPFSFLVVPLPERDELLLTLTLTFRAQRLWPVRATVAVPSTARIADVLEAVAILDLRAPSIGLYTAAPTRDQRQLRGSDARPAADPRCGQSTTLRLASTARHRKRRTSSLHCLPPLSPPPPPRHRRRCPRSSTRRTLSPGCASPPSCSSSKSKRLTSRHHQPSRPFQRSRQRCKRRPTLRSRRRLTISPLPTLPPWWTCPT